MDKASAAILALAASFHNIDAQPSGLITEYILNCNMASLSATPIARAPPEPPSPITTDMIGHLILDI